MLQRQQLAHWRLQAAVAGGRDSDGVVEADALAYSGSLDIRVGLSSAMSPTVASSTSSPGLRSFDALAASDLPALVRGECLSSDLHPSGAEFVVSNNHGGLRVYRLYPTPRLLAWTAAAGAVASTNAHGLHRRSGNSTSVSSSSSSMNTKPIEVSRVVYSHSGVLIASGAEDGSIATWLRPPSAGRMRPASSSSFSTSSSSSFASEEFDSSVQLIRLGQAMLRNQVCISSFNHSRRFHCLTWRWHMCRHPHSPRSQSRVLFPKPRPSCNCSGLQTIGSCWRLVAPLYAVAVSYF